VLVAIVVAVVMAVSHGGSYVVHHAARTTNSVWVTRAQALLVLAGFLIPLAVLAACETGAAVAGALVPPLLVGALKQTSFGYVCSTYRALAAEGTLTGHLEALSAQLGFTVGDITVGSYVDFLGAPTLNFQTAYPRLPTDWRRVARLTAEMAVIGAVCQAVALGALLPHLTASSHHLAHMDLRPGSNFVHVPTHAAIALLNTITWVVGVGYGSFHVALNLLAELVGFGDRRFYGRWWEAATFGEFW